MALAGPPEGKGQVTPAAVSACLVKEPPNTGDVSAEKHHFVTGNERPRKPDAGLGVRARGRRVVDRCDVQIVSGHRAAIVQRHI